MSLIARSVSHSFLKCASFPGNNMILVVTEKQVVTETWSGTRFTKDTKESKLRVM